MINKIKTKVSRKVRPVFIIGFFLLITLFVAGCNNASHYGGY